MNDRPERPRHRAWLAVAVALCCRSASAGGPNFPPVANASVEPAEALVGEAVALSSSGSFDPDDGPQSLVFSWDLGDGTVSSDPNPVHAYDSLGIKVITLTVDDGANTALVSVDVVVLEPPTPTRPSHSSMIALTSDDAMLVVANPDSDSISLVDTRTMAVDELVVGGTPRTVAISPTDAVVYAACQDTDEIAVVRIVDRELIEVIDVGHMPFGVAAAADGRIVVTDEGSAEVELIDPADPGQRVVFQVGASPRGIAISADGSSAFVSHFITSGDAGTVTRVDLAGIDGPEPISLLPDPGPDTASSGRGYPTGLSAMGIHPAGHSLWVGGFKANTDRGHWLDGTSLAPRNRMRGLAARIDTTLNVELMARRIDTNDADSVTGIAFSPRGRFAYLVHQGAGRMSAYDLPKAELVNPGDGDTVDFTARVDVGHAPAGVVVSADGTRAYVANYLSRDVTVFDLADPKVPTSSKTISVTHESLDPRVANGKRLFYRSREPVHSDQNYIACAGCHPDGGHDGRTWDFTQFGEGLRNTIDLRGRGGMDHGPVHWSANFDEIQDFENDIVNGFGGDGLAADGRPPHPPLSDQPNAGRSQDLDDLAAYVGSLREPPRSPHRRIDGSMTDSGRRGRALFFSDAVGCVDCHVPPRFTDSRLTKDPADFVVHDVGTLGAGSGQRLGGELTGLDTPTVLGVWVAPPYLHDGSAANLREVITSRNPSDLHGTTSHLTPDQLDDLVDYLLQLEGAADEIPDDWDGTTGTGGTSGGETGDMDSADTGGPPQSTSGAAAGSTTAACACTTPTPSAGFAPLLLGLLCWRRRPRWPESNRPRLGCVGPGHGAVQLVHLKRSMASSRK